MTPDFTKDIPVCWSPGCVTPPPMAFDKVIAPGVPAVLGVPDAMTKIAPVLTPAIDPQLDPKMANWRFDHAWGTYSCPIHPRATPVPPVPPPV
jgi:hypothetical protein